MNILSYLIYIDFKSAPKPHSSLHISDPLPLHTQAILRQQQFPSICVPALPSTCACGLTWGPPISKYGTLFTLIGCRTIKVVFFKCQASTCSCLYDGGEHGIFNYSSTVLITYDVLLSYRSYVGLSGMTFAAFCASKSQEYIEIYGGQVGFMDRATFTKAFLAFYELLGKDSSSPCSLCGQYPAILLADATDIGCPMRLTTSSLHPVLSNTADCSLNATVPFKQRVFLQQKKTRDLLAKFLTGVPSNMNKTEWNKLLKYLKAEAPSLGLYCFYYYLLKM
jgi:hypothetical protein